MINASKQSKRKSLRSPSPKWIIGMFGLACMVNCSLTFHANQVTILPHLHEMATPTRISMAAGHDRFEGEALQLPLQDQSRTRATANSANTTTTALATSIISARKNLNDIAEIFYERHLERITSLVNVSTGIMWDPVIPQQSFGPFLDAFPGLCTVHRGDRKFQLNLQADCKYIHWKNICQASKAFHNYRHNASLPPLPHVLILALDENWGAFSATIPNKTESWTRSLEYKWNRAGCSLDDITAYLDHPDTRAVITTQFQAYDHPKVHSLPLGIESREKLNNILEILQQFDNNQTKRIPELSQLRHKKEEKTVFNTNSNATRHQLLMVNCNHQGTSWREASVNKVIRNFDGAVQNTYQPKGTDSYREYLSEIRRSRFILSPGGIGLDCYRHWEALMMGTIPVMEHLNRTDGWYRAFSDLPVAWIDSYDNLTPQFLEQEYARILREAHTFKYEKLTKEWWIQMIQNQVS